MPWLTPWNGGQAFIKVFLVKIHYFHDKKSSILKLTENNDLEMTVPKNNSRKLIINGRP